MSLIIIDTEKKEIVMETKRANVINMFIEDGLTKSKALDIALQLEGYTISGVSPKKINKKRTTYKVTIQEIEQIVKSSNKKDKIEELQRLKEEKRPIIDKKTNKEKVNKEGKTIYQSNYLIIRNWFFKEFPEEKERLKNK